MYARNSNIVEGREGEGETTSSEVGSARILSEIDGPDPRTHERSGAIVERDALASLRVAGDIGHVHERQDRGREAALDATSSCDTTTAGRDGGMPHLLVQHKPTGHDTIREQYNAPVPVESGVQTETTVIIEAKKFGSNSVHWDGVAPKRCFDGHDDVEPPPHNMFADLAHNIRRLDRGVVFSSEDRAYAITSTVSVPSYDKTLRASFDCSSQVAASVDPRYSQLRTWVTWAPPLIIGQFSDEVILPLSSNGNASGRAFENAVSGTLQIAENGRAAKVIQQFSPTWNTFREQYDMCGLYAKLIHYAVLIQRMMDEGLERSQAQVGDQEDPYWLNTAAEDITLLKMRRPFDLQAVCFIARTQWNPDQIHFLRLLAHQGNYIGNVSGARVVPGTSYAWPPIRCAVIAQTPQPVYERPRALTPTDIWNFAIDLAGHRREWDALVRGFYFAMETSLADGLGAGTLPQSSVYAERLTAYLEQEEAYRNWERAYDEFVAHQRALERAAQIASKKQAARAKKLQRSQASGVLQRPREEGVNIPDSARNREDDLQAIAAAPDSQEEPSALAPVVAPGDEPDRLLSHPGTPLLPFGPYYNIDSPSPPQPIDYNYIYRILDMLQPVIGQRTLEFVSILEATPVRRNRIAALAVGLIRNMTTTALYSMNLTGLECQQWATRDPNMPERLRAFGLLVFDLEGVEALEGFGSYSNFYAVVLNLLKESTAFIPMTQQWCHRTWNVRVPHDVLRYADPAFFSLRWPAISPRIGHMLSVHAWVILRPREWTIGSPSPKATFANEMVKGGPVAGQGWSAIRGSPSYEQRSSQTTSYIAVMYGPAALNAITQGIMMADTAPKIHWTTTPVIIENPAPRWTGRPDYWVQPPYDADFRMFQICSVRSYDWQYEMIVAPDLPRSVLKDGAFYQMANMNQMTELALAGIQAEPIELGPLPPSANPVYPGLLGLPPRNRLGRSNVPPSARTDLEADQVTPTTADGPVNEVAQLMPTPPPPDGSHSDVRNPPGDNRSGSGFQ